MKLKSETLSLYPNLGYWFLSFIVLIVLGFYHSYFAVIFKSLGTITHIHFILMALWIATVIAQPFLIRKKKFSTHRTIGKMTYLLMPLVLLFTYLMIRQGYLMYADKLVHQLVNNTPQYSIDQVKQLTAKAFALPFCYFLWLGLFYSLAIINRKNRPVHARFMIAAALTIIGPTVDRILFHLLERERWFNIPIETFAFLIIDIILFFLLLKDSFAKKDTRALQLCISLYLIIQAGYFIFPSATWWEKFMTFSMELAL